MAPLKLKDDKNPKVDEFLKLVRSLSKLKDGTRDVSHTIIALPFTLKNYLEGKRRIMEIQIFHHVKI